MEIENSIFQDLKSFRKNRNFKMALGKFGCLFERILKVSQSGCSLVSYQTSYMLYLFILLFLIQNIIHQKIMKYIVEHSVFLLSWVLKCK